MCMHFLQYSLSYRQSGSAQAPTTALAFRRPPPKVPKPQWHPPWKMSSVIAGHLGWVRCVAFDPSNEWFVTGAADRTIKIWDLAKCSAGVEGGLKLTLTGHISTVRGVTVSNRHPYLFSVGEDKTVKCWDLEQNKVSDLFLIFLARWCNFICVFTVEMSKFDSFQ